MLRKLMVVLLVVLEIAACSAPGANSPSPEAIHTAIPVTHTATLTSTPQATFTPTPTATPTPVPSPTPLPMTLDGEFEFPFQPGWLPAELEAAGFAGVEPGTIESMGGTIPTGGMLAQNLIPLARDGAVLNATSGNVTFLPFPERMLTETGQEIVYSPDRSGRGWAGYVDDLGILVSKMVTSVPNGAIIVAAVSYNADNLGTVYAVKLDPAGEVLGKAHLVFNAATPISVVFENGDVNINADNNPVVPNFESGEWEKDLFQILNNQLTERGVVFAPNTSNQLELEYGTLTMRFSDGILNRSGVEYIRLPPKVMENLYLQAMGQFMYFNREYYSEEYREFFAFNLSFFSYPEDLSLIRFLAHEFMSEHGYAPLRFNDADISGLITSLEMNFVSRAEFYDSVLPTLRGSVIFSQSPEWVAPSWDSDVAAFFLGNTLEVYAYDLGAPNFYDYYDLESQYFNVAYLYEGVFNSWSRATLLTQLVMTVAEMQYDSYKVYDTYDKLMCLGNRWECSPYMTYTFTPGLPDPPIPTP